MQIRSSRVQDLRRYLASGLIGVFIAAFATHMWLVHILTTFRPIRSNTELGFVHPFNDHGTLYFLTGSEIASVNLTSLCNQITLLLAFIIVPKEFIDPPRQTPQWQRSLSIKFKTGLEEFSIKYFAALLVGLFIFSATIHFFGQNIAHFAARSGFGIR